VANVKPPPMRPLTARPDWQTRINAVLRDAVADGMTKAD
jgi:hypothetical protein